MKRNKLIEKTQHWSWKLKWYSWWQWILCKCCSAFSLLCSGGKFLWGTIVFDSQKWEILKVGKNLQMWGNWRIVDYWKEELDSDQAWRTGGKIIFVSHCFVYNSRQRAYLNPTSYFSHNNNPGRRVELGKSDWPKTTPAGLIAWEA